MTSWLKWTILISLALVWGSSFILMKRGLESFTSLEVGSYRIVMAGFVLIPFSLTFLRKYDKTTLLIMAGVGIIGNMIPAYLFTIAQTTVPSAVAGMLNSMVPLFTVVIGASFFKIHVFKKQWLGVGTGLLGAVILILSGPLKFDETPIFASSLVILATICYAVSVNLIHAYLGKVSSLRVAAIAILLAAPIPFFHLLFSGFWIKAFESDENVLNLGYISILAILGTALAVAIFNQLIKHSGAVFASSVTYLIPIVALCWGFIDGEIVTLAQVGAVAVILLAIRMINSNGN